MYEAFVSIMTQIQIGLVSTSVALALGAVYGMYVQGGFAEIMVGGQQREAAYVRRPLRNQCNLPFELKDELKDTTIGTGRIINISSGGACLMSSVKLKKGKTIHGFLPTYHDGDKNISGQIVWVKNHTWCQRYGIRFSR